MSSQAESRMMMIETKNLDSISIYWRTIYHLLEIICFYSIIIICRFYNVKPRRRNYYFKFIYDKYQKYVVKSEIYLAHKFECCSKIQNCSALRAKLSHAFNIWARERSVASCNCEYSPLLPIVCSPVTRTTATYHIYYYFAKSIKQYENQMAKLKGICIIRLISIMRFLQYCPFKLINKSKPKSKVAVTTHAYNNMPKVLANNSKFSAFNKFSSFKSWPAVCLKLFIYLILLTSFCHKSEGFHGSVKLSANTVKTKYGLIRGIVVRSSPLVEAYLGIPYASPPVGSLR